VSPLRLELAAVNGGHLCQVFPSRDDPGGLRRSEEAGAWRLGAGSGADLCLDEANRKGGSRVVGISPLANA